jgi:hypothetical protein
MVTARFSLKALLACCALKALFELLILYSLMALADTEHLSGHTQTKHCPCPAQQQPAKVDIVPNSFS